MPGVSRESSVGSSTDRSHGADESADRLPFADANFSFAMPKTPEEKKKKGQKRKSRTTPNKGEEEDLDRSRSRRRVSQERLESSYVSGSVGAGPVGSGIPLASSSRTPTPTPGTSKWTTDEALAPESEIGNVSIIEREDDMESVVCMSSPADFAGHKPMLSPSYLDMDELGTEGSKITTKFDTVIIDGDSSVGDNPSMGDTTEGNPAEESRPEGGGRQPDIVVILLLRDIDELPRVERGAGGKIGGRDTSTETKAR